MVVRNHLGRRLWSRCGAHTHRLCKRPGFGSEHGGNGILFRCFNVEKLRNNNQTQSELAFKRAISSSRRFFSPSVPPTLESPTSEVQLKQDSNQRNLEWMFRRYMPRATSITNLNGEVKRAARDGSWQRIYYVGAVVAALGTLGAVASLSNGEDTASRTVPDALLSTWSILWDSVDEFREKVTTFLSDGVADIVEVGASTVILARCLASVLVTVSEGSTSGLSAWLKPGVAALVADLVAHENRRKAVLNAGGGRVVDWLLKAVGTVDAGACRITQGEAARALAYLLSDENTCEGVLSRPHALPYLFQFASSLPLNQGFQDWRKGQGAQVDGESFRGRSMLVTAIMDVITSSCDTEDESQARPKLPENADPEDIAAALQVVTDGGWHLDEQGRKDGDSAGKAAKDKGGVHGIGITVLGGTGIVGVQRKHSSNSSSDLFTNSFPVRLCQCLKEVWIKEKLLFTPRGYINHNPNDILARQDWGVKRIFLAEHSHSKFGLWDDLQGRHITVPLAAWALATWAEASYGNRSKIAELDGNGDALLVAVLAPEKTVKWHGAMAMRLLLGSESCPLTDVAARWSSALLDVVAHAGRLKDTSLVYSALAAINSCISCSKAAHSIVFQEGLPAMREIANEPQMDTKVQGALAQVLEELTAGEDRLPVEECKKWAPILLRWVCNLTSDNITRSCGSRVLVRVVNNLGLGGIPVSQAWLAMLLMEIVADGKAGSAKGKRLAHTTMEAKEKVQVQNQVIQVAVVAAAQLAKVVAQEAAYRVHDSETDVEVAESAAELPMVDLLGLDVMGHVSSKNATKEALPKVTATEAAEAVQKAIKALTQLTAEDPVWQQRILEAGGLCLLRRLLLCNDYEEWAASEESEVSKPVSVSLVENEDEMPKDKVKDKQNIKRSVYSHIRKHAVRLLSVLTLQPAASTEIARDEPWCTWLENCAEGKLSGSNDMKTRSYASTSLLNVSSAQLGMKTLGWKDMNYQGKGRAKSGKDSMSSFWPRYEDAIFIMNPGAKMWKTHLVHNHEDQFGDEVGRGEQGSRLSVDSVQSGYHSQSGIDANVEESEISKKVMAKNEPVMDVVFIHGLRGGPYKTWRVSDNKTSTTTPMVERIDADAGVHGSCWPQEWLAGDLPRSRLLSVKYKTNLSKWSGATLPLQEVSSILLDKLLAAGVGERPLVFISHSMGGLVVKQMLLQARGDQAKAHLLNNTTGVIFYSCPHFGSKLADMPWRIGYVWRPAPTIGELRSGSPKLEELNLCLRNLHKEGHLDVLSFSETKVTPLVGGYGGWGLRMEVVPIESAYPGFGELVVLPGTDHVNSCKPLDQSDPAYTKTVEFLQKLEAEAAGDSQQD